MSTLTTTTHPQLKPNTKTLNLRLNRVEGDLEIRVDIAGNRVVDAWSAGTMYRGFENIMRGRALLDGLVITPRICGICTTAHLSAAAMALDNLTGAKVPRNAILIRNIALIAELLQSDMRQTFLMFCPDLANDMYAHLPDYEETVFRYAPFKGKTVINVIKQTKKILEIVAILGGQWPHSSYMVPGGVVCNLGSGDILQCEHLLHDFRNWYEKHVLGCCLERWLAVNCAADLDDWLTESNEHSNRELGFFVRAARARGLDLIGRGHDNFLCSGGFEIPSGSSVKSRTVGSTYLFPPAFAQRDHTELFDQAMITEHVTHSWFVDYEGGKHPYEGNTEPYASGKESHKYSWAKAPRYNDLPAETGALADMLACENPLFIDLINKTGANALVRQLARIVRPAELLNAMSTWLAEIDLRSPFYQSPPDVMTGQGFGITQAPRGALGHWIQASNGAIDRYQIITPTSWNGSPRDAAGIRGPWEEALVGTSVNNPENPVEVGHVIRSFDPCLVCTVHAVQPCQSPERKGK